MRRESALLGLQYMLNGFDVLYEHNHVFTVTILLLMVCLLKYSQWRMIDKTTGISADDTPGTCMYY